MKIAAPTLPKAKGLTYYCDACGEGFECVLATPWPQDVNPSFLQNTPNKCPYAGQSNIAGLNASWKMGLRMDITKQDIDCTVVHMKTKEGFSNDPTI
jgi:hypothetical protein